jgi:toxin HigB-1
MIKSFKCRKPNDLNQQKRVPEFQAIERSARKNLLYLDAARSLQDLSGIPGLRLEALKGVRTGQNSIRINDQYRICFVWTDERPENVEIVDYH